MAIIEGFNIPEDLYYDVENHVWVKILSDGTAIVGLDDVGQYLARRIVFIKPKPPRTHIAKGESLAELESVKWVGPIPSPLTCIVLEYNQEVLRKPSLINKSPYEAWIARIKPEKLEDELKLLVTGDEALKKQREDIKRRGVSKKKITL